MNDNKDIIILLDQLGENLLELQAHSNSIHHLVMENFKLADKLHSRISEATGLGTSLDEVGWLLQLKQVGDNPN